MPSLNRNENVTCDNCGTQTTKFILAGHHNKCSAGTLYSTQCPSISTKSQNDLNYHIAMKQSAPKADVTFKCKISYEKFRGFYDLRQHKNTQHGFPINKANDDIDDIFNEVDNTNIKEEFRSNFNISSLTLKLKG